eukprot:scaffold105548_cov24-Tisochrysis_lutea.AAC.2
MCRWPPDLKQGNVHKSRGTASFCNQDAQMALLHEARPCPFLRLTAFAAVKKRGLAWMPPGVSRGGKGPNERKAASVCCAASKLSSSSLSDLYDVFPSLPILMHAP